MIGGTCFIGFKTFVAFYHAIIILYNKRFINTYAHCVYTMNTVKRINLYIQKDLAKPLEKAAKQKKMGEGTYINELIRQALSEEGAI